MKTKIKRRLFGFKSVRTRLWFVIMSIVSAVLLIIWFSQILLLGEYFSMMKKKDVETAAERIEQLMSNTEHSLLNGAIEKIAYDNNFCIEISDEYGFPVESADMMGSGCVIHSMQDGLLKQIKRGLIEKLGEERSLNIRHPRIENQSLLWGKAIEVSGEKYVILINTYLGPIKATSQILSRQLLSVAVFVFFLSTVVVLVVSKSFTEPIRKITTAAKEVAQGNFNAAVDIKSNDEIGELAKTFNYMTGEVAKVDTLRKDLIANVSHELRIPLTMIKGYAEMIKDISGDNKEKREAQLDIIIEETDRLNSLVGDILSLSRIETGQEALTLGSFNIGQKLRSIKEKYENIYEGYSFRLNSDFDCTVFCDEAKITQVIMNLINNAINHTGEDNLVEITLSDMESEVQVSIRDTGSGIDEKELPLIWDRYYRCQKSGKRKIAGTGLGLSIVKAILVAHSVQFGVNSKLSEGSVFWFRIPKEKTE